MYIVQNLEILFLQPSTLFLSNHSTPNNFVSPFRCLKYIDIYIYTYDNMVYVYSYYMCVIMHMLLSSLKCLEGKFKYI